jgi:hypothetical protein
MEQSSVIGLLVFYFGRSESVKGISPSGKRFFLSAILQARNHFPLTNRHVRNDIPCKIRDELYSRYEQAVAAV